MKSNIRKYGIKRINDGLKGFGALFLCAIILFSCTFGGVKGKVYAAGDNWHWDYVYELDGDYIVLTEYIGSDEVVEVKNSVTIGEKQYKVKLGTNHDGIWYARPVKKLIIDEGVAFSEDCSGMFMNGSVTEINIMAETNGVKTMSNMFQDCENLETVYVSGFDTSNVLYMGFMFYGCKNLQSLDVSGFDTSNVTDMQGMFHGCLKLETLNVSGWNTSNVENMAGIFCECNNLKHIDTSGFNTQKVKDMSQMFLGCQELEELDVSGFDTSNVTDMRAMFSGCSLVKKLDVSGFDTSNVTDMRAMFQGCLKLEELNVSGFDTSNVEKMSYLFAGCKNIKDLSLSSYDTSNVSNMDYMFYFCENLQTLDASSFNTSNVSSMIHMFSKCENLQTLDVSNFNTSNVNSMSGMFSECENIKTLDVSSFNTSNVKSMSLMFSGCKSIMVLDISSFDMSKVESSDSMLYNTGSLYGIKTPKNVTQDISIGTFYDDDGNVYNYLPKNLDHSISLSLIYIEIPFTLGTLTTSASVVRGDTAEFAVSATGKNVTFQWYVSADDGNTWVKSGAAGNQTDTLSVKATESLNGRLFKCRATHGEAFMDSEPAKLTTLAVIKTQPKAQAVNEGESVSFSLDSRTAAAKYQWEVSSDNGKTWTNSGATGNASKKLTFTAKAKQNGYMYRCKATNGTWSEYSKSVKLTVKSTVVITPPTITTAPSDASVVRGNTAKFTVSASGDNLKYQWYVSSDGGKTWSASGATGNKTKSITLNATKTLNGRYFKCEISNDGGKISTSPVKLTTLSVISTQPKAQTVTEGGKATFSIASRAANASYQWEVSSDSGKTWKNSGASGNTSKAISFTSKLSQNGYCFRCKATNGSWSEYSSTVKLTVNKKAVSAPVVTTQPSDVSIIRGSTGKITVKATGTGLKYQWYVSSDSGKSWSASGLTGNKTNTITIKATESLNGKVFRCKITNEGGSVYSNKALCTTLSVIRVQPRGKMINAQSVATFSVKSRSSVVKYQWQISSDNGKTWNNSYVTGATSDTISFKAEPGQDGYCYRCKLTNGTWEEYTVKVKLRVTAAITMQPALILDNVEQPPASVITVEKDKQVRVKIKVYGNSTLYDYQWQVSSDSGKTWNDIKGATLSIYIFTPLSKQNGYKYRCVVSNKNNNSDGKAKTISDAFTLKVK